MVIYCQLLIPLMVGYQTFTYWRVNFSLRTSFPFLSTFILLLSFGTMGISTFLIPAAGLECLPSIIHVLLASGSPIPVNEGLFELCFRCKQYILDVSSFYLISIIVQDLKNCVSVLNGKETNDHKSLPEEKLNLLLPHS